MKGWYPSMKKTNSNDKTSEKSDSFSYTSRRKLKKKKPVVPIVAACAIGLIILTSIAGAVTINSDTIADGVEAAGIKLGGKTVSEAKEALSAFSSDTEYSFTLTCEDQEYTFSTQDVPYELDIESTAQKAFEYGKDGNFISKAFLALKTKLTGLELLPVFIFEDEAVIDQINSFGIQVYGEAAEHAAAISEDEKIVLTPGVTGYDGNPDPAYVAFVQGLEEYTLKSIPVTFDKKSPDDMTVEMLTSAIHSEGLDAAFQIVDGEVIITEAKAGYTFDTQEAEKVLKNLKEGGEVLTLNCTALKPKHTTEELRAKLFNGTLATYTTKYNSGQRDRSANIAIAAEKLNGVIILPGETFSFNTTVGKRTAANGFKPAAEYQNGKTVTGIGGGTCQVSTTLYSAVLKANLQIVSRRNHSMSVSYVPLGQDATVTDSGTDFKFKNNTEYPIKLKTSTGSGKVTVTIIGTEPDPAITVKIQHTSTGELSVKTTRIVYDKNGNEISRENIGTSKYKPHESESTEATPAPSASAAPTVAPQITPTPQAPVITPAPEVPAPPVVTQAPVIEKPATPEPVVTPEPVSVPEPVITPEPVAPAEQAEPTPAEAVTQPAE